MIRGQKSRPQVVLPVEVKLHNRFDFEVVDSVTGEVKQKAFAENIILNKWWDRIFTANTSKVNAAIHVGSGTGTLAPTRTTLFTYLSGKLSTLDTTTFNEEERWVSHKRRAQWLETENQNTVWTEVGIAWETGSANLTTHALIKDLNGNPVSLSKGTTDIITVYSTVYAYLPPDTDDLWIPFPRNMPPADTDIESMLLGWLLGVRSSWPCKYFYAMKGNLKVPFTGYSGSTYDVSLDIAYPDGYDLNTTYSADPATKTLSVRIARLEAANFNGVQGVKSIIFAANYQSDPIDMQLTVPGSWYPYSTVPAETVGTGDGVNLDFDTYFPFLKDDGSFVLKVNGAVVDPSLYTVDWELPNGDDLIHHMNLVDYSDYRCCIGGIQYTKGAYILYENPYRDKFGISAIYQKYCDIYVSDDPDPNGVWTQVVAHLGAGSRAIPVEHQKKRYWKFVTYSDNYDYRCLVTILTSAELGAHKNIHFTPGNAPALGAVVTADYHCGVVAKSVNNVFDLKVDITLQERVV